MTVEPTWFDRDLPVLETVIQLLEEQGYPGSFVQVRQVAERSGIDAHTVMAALAAMEHTYVSLDLVLAGGDPNPQMVSGVTAAARRAVGQWPSPETMTDRLIAALQEAVEHEDDPTKRGRLRSAADAVAGIGRDVLVTSSPPRQREPSHTTDPVRPLLSWCHRSGAYTITDLAELVEYRPIASAR